MSGMKPSSFARLRCCQARSLAVVALVAMASGLTGTFANAQTADLISASERGDLPVVNAMLSQGDVSVNAKRRDTGDAALLLASENGHLKVVQALLAAGADVDAKGYGGFTALIWASRRNHLEVVQALLAAKADVDATRNDRGRTALLEAIDYDVREDHLDVVRALVEAGANVNAIDGTGVTALIEAASRGRLAIAGSCSRPMPM